MNGRFEARTANEAFANMVDAYVEFKRQADNWAFPDTPHGCCGHSTLQISRESLSLFNLFTRVRGLEPATIHDTFDDGRKYTQVRATYKNVTLTIFDYEWWDINDAV